jgi:hypothetical protein
MVKNGSSQSIGISVLQVGFPTLDVNNDLLDQFYNIFLRDRIGYLLASLAN